MKQEILNYYDRYGKLINGLVTGLACGIVLALVNHMYSYHDSIKLMQMQMQNKVNWYILTRMITQENTFIGSAFVLKDQMAHVIKAVKTRDKFDPVQCNMLLRENNIKQLEIKLVNQGSHVRDLFYPQILSTSLEFLNWFRNNSSTCFYFVPNADKELDHKVFKIQTMMNDQITFFRKEHL